MSLGIYVGNHKGWGRVDEGSVSYADGGFHAMSGTFLRNLRETICV